MSEGARTGSSGRPEGLSGSRGELDRLLELFDCCSASITPWGSCLWTAGGVQRPFPLRAGARAALEGSIE
eukprot:3084419-Alexandrium_andersonii.AAC.1